MYSTLEKNFDIYLTDSRTIYPPLHARLTLVTDVQPLHLRHLKLTTSYISTSMCFTVMLLLCVYTQLLAGADSTWLMALDLKKDPSQYRYLSMGGEACQCTSSDRKLYEEVQRAMGVSRRERERERK